MTKLIFNLKTAIVAIVVLVGFSAFTIATNPNEFSASADPELVTKVTNYIENNHSIVQDYVVQTMALPSNHVLDPPNAVLTPATALSVVLYVAIINTPWIVTTLLGGITSIMDESMFPHLLALHQNNETVVQLALDELP